MSIPQLNFKQKDLDFEVFYTAYAWLGIRNDYRTLIGLEGEGLGEEAEEEDSEDE